MKKEIEEKFQSYPENVRELMVELRALILAVAEKNDLGSVKEDLKWGEPSYQTKHGSPLRIDWKAKAPQQYSIYFNCNTCLVETFKEVFGDLFTYEGNRAIAFRLEDKLPKYEIARCILMAMRYHKIKHLPLLGLHRI